jgi:hypothetical protein
MKIKHIFPIEYKALTYMTVIKHFPIDFIGNSQAV